MGGILGYGLSRCIKAQVNQRSSASRPGGITLSKSRLRRLCPDLFATVTRPTTLLRWLFGNSMSLVYEIGDILLHGDSGPALVMSTDPLLVAAYSENLDCVAMLRFPIELVAENDLRRGSMLLAVVNVYAGVLTASDLEHGPRPLHDSTNFVPLIADFLTDDVHQLEARKAGIDEWFWAWTQKLGELYLQTHGHLARDGRPQYCWVPARFAFFE